MRLERITTGVVGVVELAQWVGPGSECYSSERRKPVAGPVISLDLTVLTCDFA
jgi:hypothetical protein